MSNKQLLEQQGISLKRITGTGKTTCPKCSHLRKKKNDPCLSVNLTEGTWKCHNCDWKGRVATIDRSIFERRPYVRPVFNNRTQLSQSVVNWFAGRCIGQDTLLHFKITEGPEWMPQVYARQLDKLLAAGRAEGEAKARAHELARVNTIQFNYFKEGELVNVKYRDGAKNFKLAKDAELIVYNLNSLAAGATECVVCEGEIDALSWHQAGYKWVVSVPNGASKNQKLEYLDSCMDWFAPMERIYLSADDDVPGHALRDELARRFGIERCYKVDFEGLKDANEYMVAYGGERLLGRLAAAREYPIAGVYNVNDLWPEVMDIYENGLPDGDRTGDERFDEHLRFMPGELTMVTGVPSHGKSIFLEQLSLKLCLNAGWKFGIFSPETHPRALFIHRLIKKIIGKPATPHNISREDMEAMREWLNSRYHVILPEQDGFSLQVLLDKARQLVFKHGINGLILDPWNRIENTKPQGMDESRFIAEQLIKIVSFNQANGVHTFLVAHPTKMQKDADGNFEVPNLYSISGSAHFFNITQNGFTVHRNHTNGTTEVHIQKVKWEHLGQKGTIQYRYCAANTRLLPPYHDALEANLGHSPTDTDTWIPGIGDAPRKVIATADLFADVQNAGNSFDVVKGRFGGNGEPDSSPPIPQRGAGTAAQVRPLGNSITHYEVNHNEDMEPPF